MGEKTISKDRFLRNVLLLSVLIAIAFVLYDVAYVAPSFTKLLIDTTQDDAVRIARHLAFSTLASTEAPIGKESFDSLLAKENLEKAIEAFQLANLKVFSPSGEILFSIDRTEIGGMNDNEYFREKVAMGEVHTKLVSKDEKSLEGRKMGSDVLETYVPLMKDGKFLGAIEIYYDITHGRKQLSRLIVRSTSVALVLASALLVAAGFMLRQENAAMRRRRQLEEERLQRVKLQGVLEMAGAACHELNQPLQAIHGSYQGLVSGLPRESPLLGTLEAIGEKIRLLGQITGRIMNITRYETKEYSEGHPIIDIEKASRGR